MTVKEAIHCMNSYLPEQTMFCKECPYYGTVEEGGNVFLCKSDEAHLLAIKALELMDEKEAQK